MRVYFIDTSVLDNLLEIPKKSQDREQVKNDFSKRQSENSRFILPITAVIETGNHIAQLSDGQVRRATGITAEVWTYDTMLASST